MDRSVLNDMGARTHGEGAGRPKISVITVSFNSATTIEKTLRSVAEQDWPDTEHIVIDGASVDGTQRVIESWRAGLAEFVSEPDRGIYDAMNKGLSRAHGDVIAFLNSDDYYENSHVLSKIGKAMADPGLDIVYGDVVYANVDQPRRVLRRYRSDRFTPDRISWGWMPAHPALFVRRRLFEEFGGFDPGYRVAGDFEFVARIFSARKMRYVHMPEIFAVMLPGGASGFSWNSARTVNAEMLRACRRNGIRTSLFRLLTRYPYKFIERFRQG